MLTSFRPISLAFFFPTYTGLLVIIADFVILEDDIMSVEIKAVPTISVLETYSGGDKVFELNLN